MTRELEENRASIRRIEARLRDMEETIKLLCSISIQESKRKSNAECDLEFKPP